MTKATPHAENGPARATISGVVAAGLGTYRRNFGRIAVAAVLVFAPIDLVVTLALNAAKDAARISGTFSTVLWTSDAAIGVAGTMLSLVFFSGVIDRIVAVDQRGEEDLPLRETLRRLPTGRLLLASVVSTALVVLGFLLLLVPGLVLMVLFAVVGPVIAIEDLRVWRGLKRSATLTRPHALLVVVTVLVPATLDEQLTTWMQHFGWYERPWISLPVDVCSTIVVGGLVGVLEVTLAHALIADRRKRQAAKAAGPAAEGPTTPGAVGQGQAAER